MNILTAPPDFTLPAPTARRLGQRTDLAKPPSSTERFQQLGYPSPPMSDSPSPTRRLDHQHPGVIQPGRRGLSVLNGLPPPPGALSVSDQAVDPRRPLLPQYTQDQSLQQQYQTQLPHPQHPYQAPQPPSGPFTYHQPRGAPMHAPAFYPSVPVAAPYHSGYHGDLTSGPSYAANSVPTPQGPPTNDHALKTAKSARRTKAHVASACVNCKKAHLSCDAKRPCTRCVASNKQDTCYDVPHKKRGRPRLREDRTTANEEHHEVSGPGHGPAQGPVAQAWPIARHRRASSLRVLRSQRPDERPLEQYTSPFSPPQPIDPMLSNRSQVPPSTDRYREPRPVAFLNIDLVVMKSNSAFQELFGIHGDVRGRGLGDLMESGQADILQRLRNELRDEREAREPAYMPPINPRGEQEALETVSMHSVETITQSYQDRQYTWNFRLRDGQIQSLRLNIRLAKSGIFFVALIIQPFQLPVSSPAAPPVMQPSIGLPGPGRVSGASPRIAPAPPPRELPYYDPTRPSPTTTSGPPSPYGFPAGTTPLPQASQTSAYTTSPTTARGEPGYLPAYQTPQQGPPVSLLSSAYPTSSSRPPSATSEPSHHRTTTRPPRPESLQLPPLRGQQISAALVSPQFSDPGSTTLERVRRRDVAFPPSDLPVEPTPDSVKRRRLNIHEVLD